MTENGEVRFGPFRLDLGARKLWFDGVEVRLGTRAAEILRVLALAKGEVVTKDDLMAAVWPGQIIEENVIQVHVSNLRKAIAQHGEEFSFIVTAPGRGYRFVAPLAFAQDKQALALVPTAALLPPGSRPTLQLPDRPSIAVLPFQNMSGDPEQDYFADGMVEEITTALSRVRWFFVIARNSAFTYKGRSVDIRQVGRELGVRYVLEGSVRKAGNRVRVTGQLIEAESNHHVWADRFDGDLADVFELQDEIAAQVVGAAEPGMHAAEIARAVAKPTENLDAYDLYLRACREFHTYSSQSLAAASELSDQAVEKDPDFHAALSLGALTRAALYGLTYLPETEFLKGIEYAHRTLDAGCDDPTSLIRAGISLAFHRPDFDLGVATIDRALLINPNSAEGHRWRSLVAVWEGEGERSLEHMARAIRFSPFDPQNGSAQAYRALALLLLERYQDAHEAAQLAAQLNPRHALAHRAAVVALVNLGRIEEAKAVGKTAMAVEPKFRLKDVRRRHPYRVPEFYQRLEDAWRIAGLPE